MGKKYFCRKCLRFPYSRLDLLQKHIPTCPGPSKASQRLILPEEGKNYVKPKYIKNMLMKPYLITMDLEAKEVEEEKKDKEENTMKIAEQKAISYGYTIHCSDGTTQKPVINRESDNIMSGSRLNTTYSSVISAPSHEILRFRSTRNLSNTIADNCAAWYRCCQNRPKT